MINYNLTSVNNKERISLSKNNSILSSISCNKFNLSGRLSINNFPKINNFSNLKIK